MPSRRLYRDHIHLLFPVCLLLLFAVPQVSVHHDYLFATNSLKAKNKLNDLSTTTIKSIAIPFGNADYYASSSHPLTSSPLFKRAPPRTFEEARCRGQAFWDRIQEIYRNPSKPGPQFSYSDLDAAWERNVRDEQHKEILDGFVSFFNQVVQGGITLNRINKTVMAQKSPYRDRLGRQQRGSHVYYEALYIRAAATVIATDIISPLHELQRIGKPASEAETLVPHLHRWSDMLWYIWRDILARNNPTADGPVDRLPDNSRYGPQDPARLRYLAHHDIENLSTKNVMRSIINRRTGGDDEAEWPGYTFDMESDEGLALLGTPNGGGTAWVLMDRYAQLGTRHPKVTIWTDENEFY
ncbi:MAG: hypothetical protein Q9174_007312, partial [Haloplaca sp. 1 TL-2023]